jgi:hypothetical protein
MDIKISPHNHKYKWQLERAVWFYSLALMGTRMTNKLIIRIRTKDLISDTSTSPRIGECMLDTNGCEPQRDFAINVERTLDNGQMIGILAHEMTHVQQKVRNRMQITDDPTDDNITVTRWEGKTYRTDHRLSEASFPWEVEAAATAEELLAKYVSFLEACVAEDKFMHPLAFLECNPLTVTPAPSFS